MKDKKYYEKFGEFVKDRFTPEQRKAISEFQVFRYLWRCHEKHETPLEDIIKCRDYLNDWIELEQNSVEH